MITEVQWRTYQAKLKKIAEGRNVSQPLWRPFTRQQFGTTPFPARATSIYFSLHLITLTGIAVALKVRVLEFIVIDVIQGALERKSSSTTVDGRHSKTARLEEETGEIHRRKGREE